MPNCCDSSPGMNLVCSLAVSRRVDISGLQNCLVRAHDGYERRTLVAWYVANFRSLLLLDFRWAFALFATNV